MSAIVNQAYTKAAQEAENLVSILAKAFKDASSPIKTYQGQPWVDIGATNVTQQDVFYKVQITRDLTAAEQKALPTEHAGIPVKYKKSWMNNGNTMRRS